MTRPMAAAVLLLLSLRPVGAAARTVTVDGEGGGDYRKIADALTDAKETGSDIDRIFIRRGDYSETLTLAPDVTLEGEETAATRLLGQITAAEGATLQRLTLERQMTLTGIAVATIRNNIFANIQGVALSLDPRATADSGVHIRNNTFYKNSTGIELISGSSADIGHNIFVGHQTAVSRPGGAAMTLQNNWFDQNTKNLSNGTLDATNTVRALSFVSTSSNPPDLHLPTGSGACGKGAYGDDGFGTTPDTTPGPVGGVVAETTGGKVKISWDGNQACSTSVSSYGVSYKIPSGTDYVEIGSVDADGAGRHTFTVDPTATDLGPDPAAPAIPAGVTASALDEGLRVAWTKVTDADGYTVRWGTDAASPDHTADAGDTASFVIGGLTNGVPYAASVASYENKKRIFAVTAVPSDPPSSDTTGESRPSETLEVAVDRVDSDPSASAAGTPDNVSGFPVLSENSGCFVTSAGEGSALPALLLAAAPLWVFLRSFGHSRRGRLAWIFALALLVWAAPSEARSFRWIAGAYGGEFWPRQERWTDHYDDDYLWEGKLVAGLQLFPPLEIGVDVGYRRGEGKVTQTDGGAKLDPSLKQTLTVVPAQVYLLLQLKLSDNQWLIPYVAGGYSRYYYELEITDGDTTKGHQDGYHGRAGLKLLLDVLDPYYAGKALQHWGLQNTYLALEAQYARVDDFGDSDGNLGGVSYSAGFIVEF